MTIGEKLKQLMKERGISQNRLAKQAQISQSGLSTIINGSSSPSLTTIDAIAKVLEYPAWKILQDTPEALEQPMPQTLEARTVSAGMDKLPKEQREMILNMVRAMFPNNFAKGDDE